MTDIFKAYNIRGSYPDDADTLTKKKEQVIGEIRKLDPGMIIKK